jgi:hypothetical protein
MITGAPPNISDTILINGQPGDFLPCSSQGTYLCASLRVLWKSIDLTSVVMKLLHFVGYIFFLLDQNRALLETTKL